MVDPFDPGARDLARRPRKLVVGLRGSADFNLVLNLQVEMLPIRKPRLVQQIINNCRLPAVAQRALRIMYVLYILQIMR